MQELPEEHVLRRGEWLEFDLAAQDPTAPFAALSLAAAGNMSWKNPCAAGARRRFFDSVGISEPVHSLNQTHSRDILSAGSATASVPPAAEGDGLAAENAGVFLAVTAADCMPIWIWNRRNRRFALLHSGWKGTGILANGIRRLSEGAPGDLGLLLGPSIGACCYRVDAERRRIFRRDWGAAAVVERDDGPYLSLKEANLSIARRFGVGLCLNYTPCTVCNPEFGSFRREGAENFRSMLALSGYFQ